MRFAGIWKWQLPRKRSANSEALWQLFQFMKLTVYRNFSPGLRQFRTYGRPDPLTQKSFGFVETKRLIHCCLHNIGVTRLVGRTTKKTCMRDLRLGEQHFNRIVS